MRATIYHGPGDVRVEDVPDATLRDSTDAVVRVTRAGICGSDLWFFRGQSMIYKPGHRVGHEFLGVVEEVGSEVRDFSPGDLVVAPDAYSDNTCEFCLEDLHSSCLHGGVWAREADGGQGEAVRVPQADGTLVRLSEAVGDDEAKLKSALLLTDVMATGHHAAICANVGAGSTTVVIGDGAVGLCAVLAARRLGAGQIIAVGHHAGRLDVARSFGATDVVDSSAPDTAERLLDLTEGGAAAVLEAVGTSESFDLATAVARPGGSIGWVGVPHFETPDWIGIYKKNLHIAGGMAPARAYMPALLRDVEAGTLDGSPLLDMTVDLDSIADGYRAMDDRQAIKVFVEIG